MKEPSFPRFIGFWATPAQREKLEKLVRETGRNQGQTMRRLLDLAQPTPEGGLTLSADEVSQDIGSGKHDYD
jgi:hypothetical protein